MKFAVGSLVWILLTAGISLPASAATVQGTLLYEKIPATPQGLVRALPVQTPAAQILVELRSSDGTEVLARGSTDDDGHYQFELSPDTGPVVLYAWAVTGQIRVADPATGNLYAVATAAINPANWPARILIGDRNRLSGPFNIMATLRQANRRLAQIEPGLAPADRPLVVYWSPTRNLGAFQERNLIFLNGLREEDSDEFDDSMILWLYGSYLLEQFSRSDSPGGPGLLGERLDPRLAWHLGWMYFFPQAVLETPLFVDTWGPDGEEAFVLDLDEDRLEENVPGYWSAYSVASALWDFTASGGAEGPHLGLGLGPIWRVLREHFPGQVFPYLITLADGLVQNDPSQSAGVSAVLANREIDYQFGRVPPVPAPFPHLISSGVPVTGRVDSRESQRTNLLGSAEYYLVRKESEGPLRVQLTIIDEPAPGAGHLRLVLLDDQGAPIKLGQSVLWGTGSRSEIAVALPPGTYVIGVLSYEPDPVFGSAGYSLTAEF